MQVSKVIEQDHEAIRRLFENLESVADNPAADAEELTLELVDEIKIHTKAEEAGFYVALLESRDILRDFALKGRFAHKLLEASLTRLLKLAPGEGGEFKAVLLVIKELFESHAEDEERRIVPEILKAFNDSERELLGTRMQQLKETYRDRLVRKRRTTGPAGGKRKDLFHPSPQ